MVRIAETFYVVGLGSMGKRRIRNLLALGVPRSQIFGFDPDRKRRTEAEGVYGVRTTSDFKQGFQDFKPAALIISTPPDAHAPYFLFAAKHKVHFFVEVTTLDHGYRELLNLKRGSFVAAPSCTFRYAPAVRKIRTLLQKGVIGKPLVFQHYLGQYLPDWHPYEDYRKVYFARKKTGGAREMFPYELQWLSFLFGRPQHGSGIVAKVSDLDIDADDIYSASLYFADGIVGSVNIDLLNRHPARTLRIVGSRGTLVWDWLARTITLEKLRTRTVVRMPREKKLKHYNTTENIYTAEMQDFLKAVRGTRVYPYTFEEDREILGIMYDIEERSRLLKKRS